MMTDQQAPPEGEADEASLSVHLLARQVGDVDKGAENTIDSAAEEGTVRKLVAKALLFGV